jgi:hypothetical protein
MGAARALLSSIERFTASHIFAEIGAMLSLPADQTIGLALGRMPSAGPELSRSAGRAPFEKNALDASLRFLSSRPWFDERRGAALIWLFVTTDERRGASPGVDGGATCGRTSYRSLAASLQSSF